MADNSEIPAAFEFAIPIPKGMRKPSTVLALPPECLFYLGNIALLWGGFENDFEIVMLTFLKADGIDEAVGRGLSFERKAELFRRQISKLFKFCPLILLHLESIIHDAKAAQIKRNLLLHGVMVIQIKTKDDIRLKPAVTIFAKGRRKKQQIIETFTQEKIEDLYIDLAHLAGRMHEFIRLDDNFLLQIGNIPVAWQDRSFLLGLLRGHRPAPPANPPLHEGQPIPFPV